MASDCNWRLEAISKAAKNCKKTSFVLKAGENTVGKKKGIHIRIPSVLCSREHCTILLDGDKVTLKDTSRNGTYITYPKETKHFTGTSADKPLEQNDMISFGFNTASVYDVNDKNAFIYRLVKEQIETIDIDDSDDENDAAPPPNKVKIISIANKVIDIDSDSDSNYSGDECLQNIDEMEEEGSSSSSCMIEDDVSYSDEDESDELMESDDENFVVTKTILKCATPTETIALDEDDDDDVPEAIVEKPTQSDESNDKVANGAETSENDVESTQKDKESAEVETESKKDDATSTEIAAKSVENEAEAKEETAPRTEDVTESAEKDKPSPKNDTKSETDQKSKSENADKKSTATRKASTERKTQEEASTSKAIDLKARLDRVRRNLVDKAPKQTAYTNPQKLRKRRQTISEEEYNQRKLTKKLDSETQKQLRREKLAKIAEKEKMRHDEAAALAANTVRIPNVPKVKNIISRGEQLCTDMLALGSLNPSNT